MVVGWLVYIFHSPCTIQNFIMQLWMNAGCEHPESRDLTTTTRLQVGLVPVVAHLSQPFFRFFYKNK